MNRIGHSYKYNGGESYSNLSSKEVSGSVFAAD